MMTKINNNDLGYKTMLGLGLLSFALPGCVNQSKDTPGENKRPNIIYIMADDHAYQAVGSYGSTINKTPNIDRIANEGVRFSNSFCTNSICAPCRAVLLTGKYSHINGVLDNGDVFDGSQETFPRLLQENGYETAIIGKWHLKIHPTGFNYWNVLIGQGPYYNPVFIEMGDTSQYMGYTTDLITDFGINWLKERSSDDPFCLLIHHKAPHRNWMPDAKHISMYDDEDIPVPETLFDDYSTRSDAARQQEMTISDHMIIPYDLKVMPDPDPDKPSTIERILNRMDEDQRRSWDAAYGPKNKAFKEASLEGKDLVEWKYQRYIKDYLRCIASVDDNVGRLLDYLDESGLADNTIIVYTSDQGFYLGEHGWFDKRFMYEESLRMPLVIRYPDGIKKGMVNENMVLNLDFAPTFLDYAGVTVPEEMQGHSLKSLLEGKTNVEWRNSMYYHYYEYPGAHMVKRHFGIRTKRYKLIHFYYDIDAWELYDLQDDPNELNNLYENPEYKSVIDELKEELLQLQEQYGDSEEQARALIPEK